MSIELVLGQPVEGGRDVGGVVIDATGVGVTPPPVEMGMAVYPAAGNPPDIGDVLDGQTGRPAFTHEFSPYF